MPGKVDVEVSKEQAAERRGGRRGGVFIEKAEVAKQTLSLGPRTRFKEVHLNCSSAQKMPLFLPMVFSEELMASTLP